MNGIFRMLPFPPDLDSCRLAKCTEGLFLEIFYFWAEAFIEICRSRGATNAPETLADMEHLEWHVRKTRERHCYSSAPSAPPPQIFSSQLDHVTCDERGAPGVRESGSRMILDVTGRKDAWPVRPLGSSNDCVFCKMSDHFLPRG